MKWTTSRQTSYISMVKIAICFLVAVFSITILYFAARRAELSSVEQEEIRGDLSNRFLPEKGIELNGESYKYRDGITLLSLIDLNVKDQNEDTSVNLLNKKQVNLIAILVIDNKRKVLYPIQVNRNTIVDSIYLEVDSKSTEKVRIADVFSNEEGNEQGCERITKVLGKLFFGLEISDYISLDSNLLPNKMDYKQSINELINFVRLKDLSNKDNSLLTNIKSDRLLSIFLSIQSMKMNDIIVLEGEEKIGSNGLVEFHIDDNKLAELAIKIMLEPDGKDR